MSEQNKAAVRRWFDEVWNQGRGDAIDELISERSIVHGLGPEALHGPSGFRPFHAAYRNAFPDIRVQIEQMVAEGDVVAVRWRATGTHSGNGLGWAATQRPVDFSGMLFVRVEDGRLIEGWNRLEQLGMMEQIGAVTVAPRA